MGYNVLHPMGWDAFGLPAENAARDNKVNPRDWTYDNIATMKAPAEDDGPVARLGARVRDLRPDYYQHQQKLFLDFWKAGLVERKSAKVNWDPVDMTVLANEQVIDGRGWRSGALVEQRDLTQWFFKITSMSQDLLDGLDTLDRWPDKVRLMQANWIGRSEGLLIRWPLVAGTAPAGETRTRGLHDPARHDLRRVLHGDRRRSSAGQEGCREQPGARRLHRRDAAMAARRRPRSRPPRRRASTPASASCIRSTRTGRCRSMSPISC